MFFMCFSIIPICVKMGRVLPLLSLPRPIHTNSDVFLSLWVAVYMCSQHCVVCTTSVDNNRFHFRCVFVCTTARTPIFRLAVEIVSTQKL